MKMVVADPEIRSFHKSPEEFEEYSRRSINNALQSGRLTEDDAQLIRQFVREKKSTNNISPGRAFKLVTHLVHWSDYIKTPYRANTVFDLYEGIENLQNAKRSTGKPYAKNTKRDFISFLKRFYLWMIEEEYSEISEKKILKIKVPPKDTMTKTAEDMLSEEDIKAMVEQCRNSRDRAIISMLYEGGFRIGEIGTLKWNQVQFNSWNVVINTNEKTGKPRFVPLTSSRAYLAQWKNDCPLTPSGDAPVFVTNIGSLRTLQYPTVKKIIKEAGRKAGIEKKITPHLFRHSRVTHLIQKGYKDSVIKKVVWGSLSTNMFATYAHLTDTDILKEVAFHEGIEDRDNKEESKAMEPRQCSRCYTVNAPTQDYCGTCGLPLTEEAITELNEVKSEIHEDMNYKKLYETLQKKVDALEALVQN